MNAKTLGKAIIAKMRKNAPQICIIGGIVAGGAALITACIQSTKLHDIIDEGKEEMDKRDEAVKEGKMTKDENGNETPYTAEMAKEDKRHVYVRTLLKIAKLYAIPTALSALSVVLILSGCKIFNTRLVAETAAYNGAVAAYRAAQKRCEEVVGVEKANDIFNGLKGTGEIGTYEFVDEASGEVKTASAEVKEGNGDGRWFFEFNEKTTPYWSNNHMYNQKLFSCTENDVNTTLDIDGGVMVNEVLRKLGLARTDQGNRDGWIRKDLGGMDGYITIKATLMDPRTESYLIELNIDGDISEKYGAAMRGARKKRGRDL